MKPRSKRPQCADQEAATVATVAAAVDAGKEEVAAAANAVQTPAAKAVTAS